jgi:hypothetical protein
MADETSTISLIVDTAQARTSLQELKTLVAEAQVLP